MLSVVPQSFEFDRRGGRPGAKQAHAVTVTAGASRGHASNELNLTYGGRGHPCRGGRRRFLYGWLLSLSLAGDRTELLTGPSFLHPPGLHFHICVLRVRHDGSHGLLYELPWRRTIEAALNKSDVKFKPFVLGPSCSARNHRGLLGRFGFLLQHRPLAGPLSCCCRPRRRHGMHHLQGGL